MTTLIDTLQAYAEQRPGLDPRNYGHGRDGWRAYRAEARAITKQLHVAIRAARVARLVGVSDDDIRDACRGDRLTITPEGRVDYTTGQYWPTEYRAAVARVLDRAAKLRMGAST